MTIYRLETLLNFGHYKGKKTIKEVIDINPDYLAWAEDTIEWFELDDEAAEKLDNDLGWAQLDELERYVYKKFVPK